MKSTTLALVLGAVVAAGFCCAPRMASDAHAQTKPSTETKPAEEKFHSPFGDTKAADSAEALDFQKLLDIADEMAAWRSRIEQANTCKDEDALKKAQDGFAKASDALSKAMDKYVFDWSPRVYQMKGKASDALRKEMDEKFEHDREAIMKEINSRRAEKAAPAKCPVKKKHKVYTEDNPRYMENYQPPVHEAKPKPSKPGEPYPYPYPYPPPQSGDDQPSHPPTPDIPNSPYGTPTPP